MELIFPAAARNAGNREINALTEELLNKKGLPCASPPVNGNELPLVMRELPAAMACPPPFPSFIADLPQLCQTAGFLSFQSYRHGFRKLPGDNPVF